MAEDKDLEFERKQLIERLGVYMEGKDKLAPLAARVYSTLILTGKKGLTFGQLVKSLEASKSTICTHLNSLQSREMVSFYTTPGERKRFFIVAPNRLNILIQELTDNWKKQTELQEDILSYKSKFNDQYPADAFDLDFHINYLNFLQEASNSVNKLKLSLQRNHYIDA